MFKFEVIENNSPRWNEILRQSSIYDFHHTAYFHKIDSDFVSNLLFFGNDENFIALPIKLRPIDGTDYFDITSVYGYVGPVYSLRFDFQVDSLLVFFKLNFITFCEKHKVVSVFLRLHPLINQSHLFKNFGHVVNLNKTVSINLTRPAEEQRKEFRKSLKSELSQLRRKEIKVKEAENQEELDQFITIYYETMRRVGATTNYYYAKEYFYNFLNNDDFEAKLLVAIKNDKIIAGAIFTITNKIMQYHLAGTTKEFIKETPMKLILDEARLLGNKTTAEWLHLGGGVAGSDEDSLFRFKSGFSKDFKQFSVWKLIINEELYSLLSIGKKESDYFPLYRS